MDGAPPAKRARRGIGSAAVVGAVAKLILRERSLSKVCRRMLVDALPLCVPVAVSRRQPCQVKMVGILDCALAKIKASRQAAMAGFEEKLADMDRERATREASGAEELGALAAQREECEARTRDQEDEELHLAAVEEGVAKARQHSEDALKEQAALRVEEETLKATIAEAFDPLCAGTAASSPRTMQLVARVEEAARAVGAEESLIGGALVALKTAADQRRPFARKALEHLRAAFEGHIAGIHERFGSAEREQADAADEVAHFEAMVPEAKARLAARAEAAADASRQRRGLEASQRQHERQLSEFRAAHGRLSDQVSAARRSHSALLAALADYGALRDAEEDAACALEAAGSSDDGQA